MNLKTILFNAAFGVVTGILTLLFMRGLVMCCCGVPLAVCIIPFLGSMLATLLTRGPTTALGGTLSGFGHGLFAAALAVATVMIGLRQFTSDERVTAVVTEYRQTMEKSLKTAREAAEKEGEEISEEERRQMEEGFEQIQEQLAELEKDPDLARTTATFSFGVLAFLLGSILGAMGGLAGHLAIGRNRRPPDQPPTSGDPDRMQMPEQPKQWWD
jgi:hypothetical protein